LTLDGAAGDSDLEYARRLLDSLLSPWVAIPGNHDNGDNRGLSEGFEIDEVRLDRRRATVEPDYWALDVGDWSVVGFDAQLFGSGLEAEARYTDSCRDRRVDA
jgi:3',5'-cyclic AMP phosphodiesterase CpdA